jgi:hypothetical protein
LNVPDLNLFNNLRDSGGIQKTATEANGTIIGHELDTELFASHHLTGEALNAHVPFS